MQDGGAGRLTHARVLKIAIPVVISNATVPLLGIVDTGVVGQLGDPVPIGAVGIGAVILSSVFWIFGFLRMGTTGLAAQAIGAGDKAELSALLTRVLLFGGAAGLVLILLHPLLFALALRLSPGSPEVEALASTYLTIRVFSAPAAIAAFGIVGWLIAQERTTAVLVLQLWQNGINIGLSALFVLGFDWGVAGVALATLIAEWAGAALALYLCRGAFRDAAWRDWVRVRDRARIKRMVAVNTDILIRSLLIMTALTSFIFFSADFGDVPLAANQVLIQLLYVTSYSLDGLAFAAESLVGKAVGAKARAALRRAAKLTLIWGTAFSFALSLVFLGFGGAFVDLLTTSEPVRDEARNYLFWLILLPPIAMAAFIVDGVFIGATWTREMRNMMILSFLGYIACVLAFVPWLDNHGLWAALMVFFGLRGTTLIWRYPRLERAV